MESIELAGFARSTYERGRWLWASRRGIAAAGAAALTLYACPHAASAAVCITGLGIAVTAFLARGQASAAGARLGMIAGLAPCFLPALLRLTGLCTLSGGGDLSMLACATGGLLAGIVLGASVTPGRPPAFWLAAGTVVLLAGGVGCLPVGVLGLGGLVLGTALGVAPALVRRLA